MTSGSGILVETSALDDHSKNSWVLFLLRKGRGVVAVDACVGLVGDALPQVTLPVLYFTMLRVDAKDEKATAGGWLVGCLDVFDFDVVRKMSLSSVREPFSVLPIMYGLWASVRLRRSQA